jgi:hypothetical protein
MGAVFLYKYSTSSSQWMNTQNFTGSANTLVGSAVAGKGTVAVVGAPGAGEMEYLQI